MWIVSAVSIMSDMLWIFNSKFMSFNSMHSGSILEKAITTITELYLCVGVNLDKSCEKNNKKTL